MAIGVRDRGLEARGFEHFGLLGVAQALEDGPQPLADQVVVVDDEQLHSAATARRSRQMEPSIARKRAGRSGLCNIGMRDICASFSTSGPMSPEMSTGPAFGYRAATRRSSCTPVSAPPRR